MNLAIIVAHEQNHGIGYLGGLPWGRMSADMKRFFTLSSLWGTMLMGRKTFESLPGKKPLKDRYHIVLTRDPNYAYDHPDVTVVYSVSQMYDACQGGNVLCIGGAEIIKLVLPELNTMYVTEVHAALSCDVFLPSDFAAEFTEFSREAFESSEGNPYPYSFVEYRRKEPV